MVNDAGQLYTMEGIAAGLIMILTAYIVISTTSIYTTGDTHIPDMQLEQLGSDVLTMMDTPNSVGGVSRLVELVTGGVGRGEIFRVEFLNNCTMRTRDLEDGDLEDNLQAQIFLSYRGLDGSVNTAPISKEDESYTGRENAVRVTRWVQLMEKPDSMPDDMRPGSQAVLVEVLLWRA